MRPVLLLSLACVAGCGAKVQVPPNPPATPTPPAPTMDTQPASFAFDDCAAGRLPAGFSFLAASDRQEAGAWKAEANPAATTPPQCLSWSPKQDASGSSLAVATARHGARFAAKVRSRLAQPGRQASAGLVVRYQDARNYTAFTVDFASGTVSLVRTRDGSPETLASAVAALEGGWNALTVECDGSSLRCWVNGAPVLAEKDKDARPGRIGLWVSAAGKILFDDLALESRPATTR